MANRKAANKKAAQESVAAAKEAGTASVVKKDKPKKPMMVTSNTKAEKEAAVPVVKRAQKVTKTLGATPAKVTGQSRVAIAKQEGDKVRGKSGTIAPKKYAGSKASGAGSKRPIGPVTSLAPKKAPRTSKSKFADLSDAEQKQLVQKMIQKNSRRMNRRG